MDEATRNQVPADDRQTVLVVDDERLNINVLVDILKADHRVLVAKNGRQALERVAADPPDLVLLDVMMPEMDGYEVCRAMKEDERTKDIPVIFITALSGVEDEYKGFQLGAVDYVAKPFHPELVKARVRTHLGLKRKSDLLEKLAFLDALTELPNRRRFDEVLGMEWRRAARAGSSLSVILMDIDHFKLYNDRLGHLAGDDCLRAVGKAMRCCLHRPADLVARYGGEEFVGLLPETDLFGAVQLAEYFRSAVADMRLPHPASPVAPHVTISLGVASCIPGRDEAPSGLVDQADRKLYQAKQEGRNRVVS